MIGVMHRLAFASALTMAACADDGMCVESEVALDHGLYGLVTYQTGLAPENHPPVPRGGVVISVLDSEAGRHVVGTTTSNSDGVFEIALADGSYALCSDTGCVTFALSAARPLRRVDLHGGFVSSWAPASVSSCAR